MANWRFNRVAAALFLLIFGVAFGVWRSLPAPPADIGAPLFDGPGFAVGDGGIGYEVDGTRSEARYRVGERLVGMSRDQDAVGVTRSISGGVTFDETGAILPESSGLIIDLTALTSDETRRDNYIRRNTLDTGRFPTAEFRPREIQGLSFPPPHEGSAQATVVGDLTIRHVTKSQQWPATIRFEKDAMVVETRHTISFSEFDLVPPKVAVVLTVEDTIRLEARIRLVKND